MYFLVIHKATRKPFVAVQGLELQAAKERAESVYESSKMFAEHGTLASGVCVAVMPDSALESALDGSLSSLDIRASALHQCGGF